MEVRPWSCQEDYDAVLSINIHSIPISETSRNKNKKIKWLLKKEKKKRKKVMQNFILFYLWLFVMALSFMGTLKSTLCERNHIISLNWGSYCTLPGLGWELALWNEEVNEFL